MGAMASLMYVVEWGIMKKNHGIDLLILLSPAGNFNIIFYYYIIILYYYIIL
jgi:hypothetical protein